MDALPDFVAQVDQAEEMAKDIARPLIAFHKALSDAGMHEVTVNELLKLYAASLFGRPKAR